MRRRGALALALACGPIAARAQAQRLTIAAASDLRFALDELLRPLRAAHAGSSIEVVYGSSGKLATQIRHGAPFDVFLSADVEFARKLSELGLAGAPRLYALGRLAAWSTDAALGRLPLDALVRHPRVQRFAIANPEHAPYGRRAMEALRHLGLAEVVRPKLVLGETVSQAATFIESGAAQAGLIAYSLVLAPALAGKGAWTLVPEAWHSRLEQAFVLTRRAQGNALAAEFVRHLDAPATRALLARHGFTLPADR